MDYDRQRLERLRAERRSEDDRLVCVERGIILLDAQSRFGGVSHVVRQSAALRLLCERITPVIRPDDILVGCMPEVVPSQEEESLISERKELFSEPGVPGWLDSLSIYIPDWDRLLELGLGGIAAEAAARRAELPKTAADLEERREFLVAVGHALESVSLLIGRYAAHARHAVSTSIFTKCADRGITLLLAHKCSESLCR